MLPFHPSIGHSTRKFVFIIVALQAINLLICMAGLAFSFRNSGAFYRANPKHMGSDIAETTLARHAQMTQTLFSPDAAHLFVDQAAASDYRHFTQHILPQTHGTSSLGLPVDEKLLASWHAGESVHLSIYFNESQTPNLAQLVSDARAQGRIGYENEWLMAGTYTSPIDWPAGLAIARGVVINPAVQTWDGLLVIDRWGQPTIWPATNVYHAGRRMNVANRKEDLQAFIKLAQQKEWTVIQSHLLVWDDSILVDAQAPSKLFRRRALFLTEHGDWGIYDSQDARITLRTLAESLRESFQAVAVLNLDMGSFNYCQQYQQDRLVADHSELAKGVILSNLIIIQKDSIRSPAFPSAYDHISFVAPTPFGL